MKPLTSQGEEIRDSRIPPREFELRMHERIEVRHSIASAWTTRYLTSRKPFYGIFKKNRFSLQRKTFFWIWCQPIVYGEMTPLPTGGIRVHLKWRAHPGTRLFQGFCALAFVAALYFKLDPRLVAAPLVLIVSLPVAYLLELPGARKALENLLRPE